LTRACEHDGLIVRMAKRYAWACGNTLDMNDLLQAGRQGVMRARLKYDPTRGIAFTTYASHWIKAYLKLECQQARTVYVPTRASTAAWRSGGSIPITSVPIAIPVQSEHGAPMEGTLLDAMGLVTEHDHESELDRKATAQRLARAMRKLNPRERRVLKVRFWREGTLSDAGDELGVTRERARQIQQRALQKLAECLASP